MAKKFICSSTEPIVQTKAGKLRGYLLDTTYTFHGIKYADAKRFMMPTPVEHWEGVKDAHSYGSVSPLTEHLQPQLELLVPHRYWIENENCQFLNIWTQSLDRSAKKPVMVWLHGGGYSAGSSIEIPAYDGDNLSKFGDVVVVTFNHRLNILGYLDLSDFGDEYANSGNAGMADIVEALKWVQNNIAGFGGDPNNVTIFGQSGGGGKVTTLGQIPAAEGLFHKMIVMSGVLGGGMFAGERNDRLIVEEMLKVLELKQNDVKTFETIPYPQLAQAYNKVIEALRKDGWQVMPSPIQNDWYTGDPLEVGFSEYAKKIPTMVGTVIAEFAFERGALKKNELSAGERKKILEEKFGDSTDKLIKVFKKAYPDKNEIDILSVDTFFRLPTLKYLQEKSAVAGAPVYSYMFSVDFDYDDGKPAWHCSDIPFAFHNCDKHAVCNIEGVTDRLEDQVSRAYINFARYGDPNNDKLPRWDAFTPQNKATMVFDVKCEQRIDYEKELMEILTKFLP